MRLGRKAHKPYLSCVRFIIDKSALAREGHPIKNWVKIRVPQPPDQKKIFVFGVWGRSCGILWPPKPCSVLILSRFPVKGREERTLKNRTSLGWSGVLLKKILFKFKTRHVQKSNKTHFCFFVLKILGANQAHRVLSDSNRYNPKWRLGALPIKLTTLMFYLISSLSLSICCILFYKMIK